MRSQAAQKEEFEKTRLEHEWSQRVQEAENRHQADLAFSIHELMRRLRYHRLHKAVLSVLRHQQRCVLLSWRENKLSASTEVVIEALQMELTGSADQLQRAQDEVSRAKRHADDSDANVDRMKALLAKADLANLFKMEADHKASLDEMHSLIWGGMSTLCSERFKIY